MVFSKAPFILAAAFLVSILPAASQVIPAAQEASFPLSVGVGPSVFSMDWGNDALGHRRPIWGASLWIDWHFVNVPHYLNGFGVEVVARDISKWGPKELSKGYGDYECGTNVPPNCLPNPSGLREDTAEAGIIYTWHRRSPLHPYGKFLAGYGNMDFPAGEAVNRTGAPYTHDTRTLYSFGGGLEYRIMRKVEVRADYEYQFWPDFLGHTTALNPNGASVGVLYSFKPFYPRLHKN